MPTHSEAPSFWRDWQTLSHEQRLAFLAAVSKMKDDLKAKSAFRKSLRIKGIQKFSGIFEMTWADDVRATFSYGISQLPGEAHIIWRRVGFHDIFRNP